MQFFVRTFLHLNYFSSERPSSSLASELNSHDFLTQKKSPFSRRKEKSLRVPIIDFRRLDYHCSQYYQGGWGTLFVILVREKFSLGKALPPSFPSLYSHSLLVCRLSCTQIVLIDVTVSF